MSPQGLERFLVCGLGSLGQHCVVALKEFGVSVIGIEQKPYETWEIPNLPQLLDELVIGDCRQNVILTQAKIQQCRAVLVVTSDEEVNAETALTVRQMNPRIRIIIRSAEENLNQLLSEQLGNFFADEPTQLATAAFALAGLGNETIGFFKLDGQRLQVIKHKLKPNHPWCNTRSLHDLHTNRRRILTHVRESASFPDTFHQWDPDAIVRPGDILVYIETVEQFALNRNRQMSYLSKRRPKWRDRLNSFRSQLKKELNQLGKFSFLRQIRSVALVCSLIVLMLLVAGTTLFQRHYPDTTWLYAFYATVVLLLGGYGDLFANFEPVADTPWWLQLFALGLTVVGTAFVGVLYASITEALLSAKFELLRSRPAVPQEQHLVIVGLGRVGQRVAAFLQELQQSLVGITFDTDFDRTMLPEIPLVIGNLKEALPKANFATARSILITTDNEMLNLEIALMARATNPESNLVIGTYKKGLSHNLNHLLKNAQVIGAYEVGAEAFAGAAFGENILGLFRQNNQTILVTEYQIEADDTLNGLLLGEIAYGYGVIVILHQSASQSPRFMPSDDIPLNAGDRIVVLASGEGLRRIEGGRIRITTRCWRVRVEKVLTDDAIFEGANLISRISGCSLVRARNLMNNLPQTLPTPLYKHQGQRLVRELKRVLVKADLVALSDGSI